VIAEGGDGMLGDGPVILVGVAAPGTSTRSGASERPSVSKYSFNARS